MTLVGNSPGEFSNITYKKPMNSEELADELKRNDIFLTASQKDPCSNSLIEALHCGLPAIALHDGGHTEIVSKGGEVFNTKEDLPILLDKIINNYHDYQKCILLPCIDEVGKQYYEFLSGIYKEQKNDNYISKRFNFFNKISLKSTLIFWKLTEKWNGVRNRLIR
jgi:glycosyltransferase involved in cell wall biosynthesis